MMNQAVAQPPTAERPLLSPPLDASLGLEGRLEALEKERADLWSRLIHLERLAQAGLMAGGLAHDTRNLLAALSGHCQLALGRDPEPAVAEHMKRAVELSQKASQSMNVFLSFARGHGKTTQVCRIDRVVTDAAGFLAPTLRKADTRLVLKLEDDLRARCEPTLLLQALVNLVLNAVRAIGDRPGVVEIRGYRAPDGDALLDVADDGPGISPAIRSRLFQPFATAPGTRAPAAGGSGGTGLGLFVTRRVLEEQGGSIVLVEGDAPGAVFRIRLPAGESAPAANPVDVKAGSRAGEECLRA